MAPRTSPATLLAFLLVLMPAVPLGCQRRMTVEHHRVSAAVREYNLALPRTYRLKRTDFLKGLATDRQIGRIWTLVLGLSQRQLVLDSRREEAKHGAIEVKEVLEAKKARKAKKPKKPKKIMVATVLSTETWWYRHISTKTRKVGQAPRRLRYRIRYHLVLKKGRWLVDRLEILESKKLDRAP